MSDKTEKLWQELQAAQRTVAELQAKLESRETGQQSATQELEESRSALLFMLEDLDNARKRIEQSHREWMAALDAVGDPIFLHDKEFRIMRANRAYQRCAAIPFKEIIGRLYYEVFPKFGEPLPGCRQTVEKGEDGVEEEVKIDGVVYRSRAYTVHDEQGEYSYSVHSLEDVTERKKMGSRLLESEARLSEAQHLAQIGSWELDLCNNELVWSDEIYRIFEIDPMQFGASYDAFLNAIHPDDRDFVNQSYGDSVRERAAYDITHRLLMKDGRVKYVREICRTVYGTDDKPTRSIGTVQDITERKQHEIVLQRSNRALLTISAGNQALIHAVEEGQLLHEMCDVAVLVGGYRLAWIGFARHDADKTIEQMALSGFEKGWPNPSPLTWNEARHASCPAGRAIISGTTRVVQDILSDPELESWHENARQYGYASCIALPLMNAKHAFGVLVLFDDKMNVFDMDEVKLLEEMSGDLAFGILTLRIKEAHREHEQRLQKNMLQTVEAIASIVEMRDPYTSGHQARVAALAKEIARQMGLAEEEVQAIHLAGLVHDLGKIRIPAEILSKPGRLNEIEYSLIKMHPQAGYDILKGVDFSWPIAEMVLQHHERMDGSGYPQELKGEGILLGARILIVADVVEAMSSHRPYRPGLGVDAALEEITRSRGTRYDEKVVDACVALFREREYVLPG
ncbi:MAG: HD domain-containing protein [Nitrosomonadales bacterium]|nr:HD domain-containing protein [Nitrosomonadales bacterium]